MSPWPPALSEAPPTFCSRAHSCTDTFLEGASLHPPGHVRNFPSNQAGTLNPGDDSLPYNNILTAISRTTAVRRGSAVEMLFPTTSPRPQHRGPSSCGTMPPSLPPECMVFFKHMWRRRQTPVRILHSVRDLPPPPHRTALPCGPRLGRDSFISSHFY